MTTTTTTTTTAAAAGVGPVPAVATTRRLLGCAAVAGPLFVVTFALQALTRDGFEIAHHPISVLSLGEYGWIQVANFLTAGVLFVAGAVGLRRAMAAQRGDRGHAIASVAVGLAMFAPDALLGTDGFLVAVAAAIAVGWCWVSYVAFHVASELELTGDAR